MSSVTVGPDDRIRVLHRPRTGEEDQGTAAPAVLAFEPDGTFVRAWGGPAEGYDWPANEHGIHVDPEGNVWVGGNSARPESDDMLLKFTPAGELLLQIGGRARSSGNDDTVNPMRPAESFVRAATNEVFVADGYGNRRGIVFDADTGDYKRMWGAFGNTPMAPSEGGDEPAGPEGPPQFGIVHGIEVSSDGLVYVADRGNSRVQVFDADGTYRTQGFVNRGDESSSTVAGLAFSTDAEQQFMYSADQGNSHIHVIERATLEVLDTFGSNGMRPPGSAAVMRRIRALRSGSPGAISGRAPSAGIARTASFRTASAYSELPRRPPRASPRPAPAACAGRCGAVRTPRRRRDGAPSRRPRRPPCGRSG